MRYFPLNSRMTCRQAPRHKQNELTTVKPALFPEPSPPPGAHQGRGRTFRRDRQVSTPGLGAFSVAGDIRAGRQNNESSAPGGRRYDLSLSASERRKPTPAPGTALLAFRTPSGRMRTATRFQEGSVFGSTPRVRTLPQAPSSNRSLLPTPFHSNHPLQPQQARPSVGARASKAPESRAARGYQLLQGA